MFQVFSLLSNWLCVYNYWYNIFVIVVCDQIWSTYTGLATTASHSAQTVVQIDFSMKAVVPKIRGFGWGGGGGGGGGGDEFGLSWSQTPVQNAPVSCGNDPWWSWFGLIWGRDIMCLYLHCRIENGKSSWKTSRSVLCKE